MTNAKTGGRAFPSSYDGDCQFQSNKGMTLADWFAGKALVGIVAQNELVVPANIARYSYEIADAMIAEKHRREGKDER